MRGSLNILICLFFCFVIKANAQVNYTSSNNKTASLIDQFLLLEKEKNPAVDQSKFEALIRNLEGKRLRKKNDLKFLQSVFFTTHRRLLINYDKLANLEETFEKGSYGCLSGTMTYALILEHFGFDYQILELPNHVFLQVKLKDQNVYFESTLPVNGFITSQNEVYESIEPYLSDQKTELIAVGNKQASSNDLDLKALKIDLVKLGALQHFNEAIKDFNVRNFEASIHHAVQAYANYPSERNLMLMQLILNKIRNCKKADNALRASYLSTFKSALKEKGLLFTVNL